MSENTALGERKRDNFAQKKILKFSDYSPNEGAFFEHFFGAADIVHT
ncbi:MAG: hypothetical protein LBI69_01870 [Puniceicoccales bacterium]|nr:hypothetical protein [Puniceicoccales bacterium]